MSDTNGNRWVKADYFPDERDQKALQKDFQFKNFADALKFTIEIGKLAEKANHHPDINLGWGYVRVWLTSHSEHKITEKDHELAKKIDQIQAHD